MSLLAQVRAFAADGAQIEPELQPGGVAEVADDAAGRPGTAPNQCRRGDDLVARDQRGLLVHVDDLQVDVAVELFVANPAHGLDGVDRTRGRAIDIEGQRPLVSSCVIGHAAVLPEGRSCSPASRRSLSERSPTSLRIGNGSLRTTVGTARIWSSAARRGFSCRSTTSIW